MGCRAQTLWAIVRRETSTDADGTHMYVGMDVTGGYGYVGTDATAGRVMRVRT